MPYLLSSDMREVASRRFSEVDSLRAIACALVIISHTISVFYEVTSNSLGLVTISRGLGGLGVLLFFSISGYVIPNSLRGTRTGGLKRFAIHRFFRLWPTFWICLILIYLADYSQFSIKQFLIGATMVPTLLGVDAIGGHFWTLEIELIFYVLAALLFWVFGALRKAGAIVLAYLIVIAWCLSWDSSPEESGYWLRLPVFLSIMFYGACCRVLMKPEFSLAFQKYSFSRAIALGSMTGLVSIWPIQGAYFGFIENDLYQVSAGSMMLTAILGFLFWVLVVRVRVQWLSRVGRWTYSSYLFHWFVLYSILSKLIPYMSGWPLPLYIVLVLGLSVGIGALAYRWIEQPSDRIGKRIAGG